MPHSLLLAHTPPLVLVVDDDRSTRFLLRRVMESEGYQVQVAEDGYACLALYQQQQPHIVLLDAMMPEMDGFDCAQAISQLPGGDRTPILMITALDDSDSVNRAFAVGATDYITKPINWAVLKQRVRRLIQQFQLLLQLEAANQELQRLATLDGLTQLANRRRFDEYLQWCWAWTSREKVPLSLILCDIDCFKLYNDTYGHPAGDDCLKAVAQALKSVCKRSSDLVARYGGEEFAAILPHTNAQGALYVASQMHQAVRGLALQHLDSPVQPFVTLSIGVATILPRPQAQPAHLLAVADHALYQAKHQGRDRTIVEIVCPD